MKSKAWIIGLSVCGIVLLAAVVLSLTGVWGLIGYNYANAEQYTPGGTAVEATVRNLEVDWIDGRITVAYHSEPTVLISETSKKDISGDLEMRWWLDGDTLRIRYAKSGLKRLSWNLQKELTVTLPEGMALQNVSLSATSSQIVVPSLTADTLNAGVTSGDIDAAVSAAAVKCSMTSGNLALTVTGDAREITAEATSGSIRIQAENAETLRAGMTSGNVQVKANRVGDFKVSSTSGDTDVDIAEAGQAKIGATSGKINVKLAKFTALDVDSTSGNVKALLPAVPGFTLKIEKTSGDFTYGMPLEKDGSSYRCGDGSASARIHVTSGDIRIDPIQ